MLEVMLCGASDTSEVRDEFVEVVRQIGGSPLHYLSGDILYVNMATASWAANSRLTVQNADLCVFVIVRTIGELTWATEFREVVTSGKPFLVLCLADTYERYLRHRQTISDGREEILAPEDRTLVATLLGVETEFQTTVATYPGGSFQEVLRRHFALHFEAGLRLLETQSRRQLLTSIFYEPEALSSQEIIWSIELALDDLEDKGSRKRAIHAIAARSASDDETTLALLRSPEQGVQRTAFEALPRLHVQRPPDPYFLSEVVEVANDSDDVGVSRRLIPALFAMGLEAALRNLKNLDVSDTGLRRRIAQMLEEQESHIETAGLIEPALDLARRCESSGDGPDWKLRLKRFIERHSPEDDGRSSG